MTVLSEIRVVAGALFDDQQRVLIAQRPAGKHLAGGWEFPGGKIDGAESKLEALTRELLEELGVTVQQAEPLIDYVHQYAERSVHLDLWLVSQYSGQPQSREGQALKWVELKELPYSNLLEADLPLITALHQRFGIAR